MWSQYGETSEPLHIPLGKTARWRWRCHQYFVCERITLLPSPDDPSVLLSKSFYTKCYKSCFVEAIFWKKIVHIGTIWYKFYFFLLVSLVKVKLEINLAVKQKWSFVLNSFGRIVGDMVKIITRMYFYNSYNSHQMQFKDWDKSNLLKRSISHVWEELERVPLYSILSWVRPSDRGLALHYCGN